MTCHDTRELFSARVDDALTPEERAALEAHLAGCPECRRELARFEGTVALLRGVAPARAPVGFVDRVLAAARPVPWRERLRGRLFQPLAWGRPIEVMVVALVAVTTVYLHQRTPELQPTAGPELSYPTASQAARAKSAAVPPETAKSGSGVRTEESRDALSALAKKEQPSEPRAVERYAAQAPEGKTESAAQSGRLSGRMADAPPAAAPPAPAPASRPAEAPVARERQVGAREDAEKRALARSAAPGLASKVVVPADVTGRLGVTDRAVAEWALRELLVRLNATEVAQRAEADALVVEAIVPGPAYPELVDGLARIGRWQPDRVPAELPPQVRVNLRITD